MANGLKALGSYLADDTLSDEALDFFADPYADRVTRIQRSGQSSPELQAFLARAEAVQERRDAERAVEAAARLPQVKAREDTPRESVPPALRPSNWVTSRPASSSSFPSKTNGGPVGSLGVVPVPPPEGVSAELLGPFFRPVNESNLPPESLRLPVEPSPTLATVAPRSNPPALTTPDAAVRNPVGPPAPKLPVAADVAAPIPTASSVGTNAIAPTTPGASKPPPVEAGSGGDDELSRLSMGQALVRALEGSGSVISGQNLRSGAADTLGERMKQIEALRAKRQEKEITDAQEVANNKAQVDYLISRFPEQADSLTKLYGMTRKANFPQFVRLEEQIALDRARAKTEGVKPEVALRGAAVKEAGQAEKEAEGESKRLKREQDAAIAWFRANAAAKPAAEERGIKPQDLTARLEKLNVVTKPYQEMVSSLREADAALSDLSGAAPTGLERIAGAIPGGERFLRSETLRAKRAQEGLKESYQKLKTGLAAVGQELTSFERRFGLNWFADPRSAPLAIESLKEITREALRSAQAPYGGGTGNPAVDQLEVLSLAKKTGSLTSDSPVFAPNPKLREAAGMKPAEAPAPVAPARAPVAPAGMVRMRDPSAPNRVARIPSAEVDARKAQGWTEVE